MSMFTRTISTFKATASVVKVEDGMPSMELIGTAEFQDTAATKTQARKALAEAGYTVPRGAYIAVEKVREDVYGCTVEQFMSVAHVVETKEAE